MRRDAIRLGLGFIAATVAAMAVAMPAARADRVLNPGRVAPIIPIRDSLWTPADGWLNGYGFVGQVQGIGFSFEAGAGDQAVAAGQGAELVVVRFRVQRLEGNVDWLDGATVSGPGPAVTVVAGSRRISLPAHPDLYGAIGGTYAVAVPKGSPVLLELSRAGFAQSMDLRTGLRTGTVPAALYRDPAKLYAGAEINATQTVSATVSPGGESVRFRVRLNRVALTFFGPAGTPIPPDDGAYLLADFDATPRTATTSGGAGYRPVDVAAPLPPTAMHLLLPDGTRIAAQFQRTPDGQGLLGGRYFFAVPASIGTARVVIDAPGAVAGQRTSADRTTSPVTLSFGEPVTFDFSVPDSAPAPAPLGASPQSSPRHGHPDLAELAGLALVLAVGAGAIVAMRHQVTPAIPGHRAGRRGPQPSGDLEAIDGADEVWLSAMP